MSYAVFWRIVRTARSAVLYFLVSFKRALIKGSLWKHILQSIFITLLHINVKGPLFGKSVVWTLQAQLRQAYQVYCCFHKWLTL